MAIVIRHLLYLLGPSFQFSHLWRDKAPVAPPPLAAEVSEVQQDIPLAFPKLVDTLHSNTANSYLLWCLFSIF